MISQELTNIFHKSKRYTLFPEAPQQQTDTAQLLWHKDEIFILIHNWRNKKE